MVFRVGSDFGEPGAGHHDAGGSDGLFVQGVEAGGLHGMGDRKMVSKNDQEFRIGRIAQAFGCRLILRTCARCCESKSKQAAAYFRRCTGSFRKRGER